MSTPSGKSEPEDVISAYAPKRIRERAAGATAATVPKAERAPSEDAPLSPDVPAAEGADLPLDHPDQGASLQPDSGSAAAPPEAAHATGSPPQTRKDTDLERLEASLRWLQQRQTAHVRLPPAPTLSTSQFRPIADGGGPGARGRRTIVEATRPPLRSLEPEPLELPPVAADRSPNTMLFVSIACIAMAAVVYYFLETTGEPPTSATASGPQMASVAAPPVLQPAEVEQSVTTELPPSQVADSGDIERNTAQEASLRPALPQAANAAIQPESSSPQQTASISPRQTEASPRETAAMPAPAIATAPRTTTPVRTLDAEQIKLLVEQGEKYIAAGDVVAARTIFQRAAEAGDATAALALAATYDPIVLAKLGVMGMGADVEKARAWYQMAESYGSAEASQRLLVLNKR
jgi:hypothetical protein